MACACALPGVALGALLVGRRRRLVGVLLIALGLMPLALLSPESPGPIAGAPGPHGMDLVLAVLEVSAWILFYLPPALLAAYFPDGRLPSRRWRWLPAGWVLFVVGFNVAVALDPGNYGSGKGRIAGSPPIDVPEWLTTVIGVLVLGLLLSLLVASVACVVARFRHGTPLIRRQLKWFALSVLLLPLVLVTSWMAYLLTEVSGTVVVVGLLAVFVSVPVTVAIAILRHDLYDIDRLLSRTVSYVIVSGLLSALFVFTVVAAGLLVGRGSDLSIAGATLACALAFGPARRRVQVVVDSRFDRTRDRALVQVARFVEEVRDGRAAPEQIEQTLRLALSDPGLRIAYAVGSDPEAPWRDSTGHPTERPSDSFLDVAVGRRLLGSVVFTAEHPRPQLVRDVLREAHLPLELTKSRIELRHALDEAEASRARLLHAGDAERRQLERDLHDGAQQHLVAIGMALKLAQQDVPATDSVHDVLGLAVRDLQDAVGELRRLAAGVRPRGLDEGLPAAIRSLVRSCPLPVEVHVSPDEVPDDVATTAYYVAAEALTNALKHSGASSLGIEVSRVNGSLHVVVTDRGCGGAQVVPGSGLSGLRDRVLATGGHLEVRSVAGHGTEVEARLPCG